jgi:rod shape-determining protein MreB
MNGRYPTEDEQKTLPNAGDWVDEHLHRLLTERHEGLSVSIHTVREWKEQHSFIGKPPEPVTVTVPIAGKPTELDITEEMKAATEGLVPPISETMIDLIAAVESEYQEKVRHNIILAGGTSAIPGLAGALERTLKPYGGGKIIVSEDPVYIGANGALALAQDAPKSDWEKLPA